MVAVLLGGPLVGMLLDFSLLEQCKKSSIYISMLRRSTIFAVAIKFGYSAVRSFLLPNHELQIC